MRDRLADSPAENIVRAGLEIDLWTPGASAVGGPVSSENTYDVRIARRIRQTMNGERPDEDVNFAEVHADRRLAIRA